MATRATTIDLTQLGRAWRVNRHGCFSLHDSQGHPVQLRGRKARAIVAYLSDRPGEYVSRERIIGLLWMDRQQAQARGSLRQSLGEIRREAPGLISSDTDHVWIDPCRVQITPIDEAADDKPLFDDLDGITAEFDEWLVCRRHEDGAARSSNLQCEIEASLSCGESAKALRLIERLQRIDPYNEDALRLAMRAEAQAGRPAAIRTRFTEMEQRLNGELGIPLSARTRALHDELLAEISRFSPTPPRLPKGPANRAPEENRSHHQHIAFARTADGVTIAHSRLGSGPPLVKAGNGYSHLEHELENPLWRHWIDELSSRNTLVRYDQRGTGLSDRSIADLSLDLLVDDLGTVVDASGLSRFDLFAGSQGVPVAIAFTARHPERVARLVLVNGFPMGWRHSPDDDVVASWDALLVLARSGRRTPGLGNLFANQYFPEATAAQLDWSNKIQKQSTSPEMEYRYFDLCGSINVVELLKDVRAPTLVMHCKGDQMVPVEAGRFIAAQIPSAEFVALDGSNHLPLATDACWPIIQEELRRFLA
jgi:pimeloyl-ACP methyl ester carboxylesterase/DNA-binding SARP family transcriptional activator